MPSSFSARSTRAATAPRLATMTLWKSAIGSVARRPGAHQVLPHAVGEAQPVHVEHADEVVARLLGADHRLHRVHRGHVPDLAVAAHARERLVVAGLAGL